MHMDLKYLHTREGQAIPVRVATWNNRTFLECLEPEAFLHHISSGPDLPPLPPDTFLRGVVIHGEGATFQLRDQLGTVQDEIARLTESDARALVLDHLW